ncbi:MAG TPA: DUF6600 domain-containing protein [Casimicrobiaceae bacterium]
MKRCFAGRLLIVAIATMLAAFAGIASADPPSRVIRLSLAQGALSFAAAGSDEWVNATLNRPLVYGDRLWADENGRGELELGNATLWVGPRTALDVMNLDDRVAQFQLSEGEIVMRVRSLDPNETVEVDTPNLAFVVTRAGRYHVSVDAQGQSTLVAVNDGTADVYGEQASYVVSRGQRYRFHGTDLQDAELVAASPPDAVERFALDRERRRDRVASVRYVSPEVIGVSDLDQYGTWTSVSDYGNVWVPREVPQNWAPYRYGHWSWIDPWGWTWIDDAPWGFAPFHYGRWAYLQSRWCWVPGPRNVQPVYAPALVAWFGGSNFGVSVSSGPAVGWVPLAPREVYRPWYDASPQYVRQVNLTNTRITNVTVINNIVNNPTAVTQVNQFVNLRAPNAVTAVPPAALAQAQPVARVAVAVRDTRIDKTAFQPAPKIEPAAQALLGPAKAAQAKPPARVMERTVVAKTTPPPPPISVQQKIQLVQREGKPIDPRAAAVSAERRQPAQPGAAPAGAPGATAGARPPANVRMASASKPAPTAVPSARGEAHAAGTPPARNGPATGAATAAPSAAAAPPTATAPARPGRPETAQPPREEAKGPPSGRPGQPQAAQPPREEAQRPASRPGSPQTAQAPHDEAKGPPPARPGQREVVRPGVANEPESARPGPAREREPARPEAAPSHEARPPQAGAARAPEAAAPKAPSREERPGPARTPEAALREPPARSAQAAAREAPGRPHAEQPRAVPAPRAAEPARPAPQAAEPRAAPAPRAAEPSRQTPQAAERRAAPAQRAAEQPRPTPQAAEPRAAAAPRPAEPARPAPQAARRVPEAHPAAAQARPPEPAAQAGPEARAAPRPHGSQGRGGEEKGNDKEKRGNG